MAYRFENDEGVRTGILRCAGEQLESAVIELTERIDDDPVEAVHSARKAVKKERALLRLVRGSMSAEQRRRENAALRHAAQGLSTARDAEAMIDTLDQLSKRYAGQLPETTFRQIRARLEQQRDRERAELIGSSLGARAAEEFDAVRARSAGWTLSRGGWRAVEQGLRRSYRDGRALFSEAQSQPAFAEWHTWRKRVKDLWYQERLLATVAGPAVTGQVKDAHRLADALGDEHDLGVLRASLHGDQMTPPVDLDGVIELIDYRRHELQTEAIHLGSRVYVESPKRFIWRMRSSWEAGRALARAAYEQDPAELAHAGRASS
jgi:CHAD domain-containing protein